MNNFTPFLLCMMTTSKVFKTAYNMRLRYSKIPKATEIVKAKRLLLAITPVYLPHLIPLSLPTGQPHWPRTHRVVFHLRAWLFFVPYAWNALCSLFMWQTHSHPSCVNSDFSDTERPSLTALGQATSGIQLSVAASLSWFPSWHSL